AVERMNRNYDNRRVCLLVHLPAELIDLLLRICVDHARKVCNIRVVGSRELADSFGTRTDAQDCGYREKQDSHTAKSFHRAIVRRATTETPAPTGAGVL